MAEKVATERLGSEHQIDTYFVCQKGRLKLREINSQTSQLIFYERPDDEESKLSRYCLINVTDPESLKNALSSVLGIENVVDKQRDIYLYENVRIHLDRVAGLGSFLEFEAVLSPVDSKESGREQLAVLCEQFGIVKTDLVAASYTDMG